MKITIHSTGKTKQQFVLEGELEYLKRIKNWVPIEIREVPTEKLAKLPDIRREEEEARFLTDTLKQDTYLVVLDEQGKMKTSKEVATLFRDRMNEGVGSIVFAIGGATGWHRSVKEHADIVLSLSPLTFTYQMTRLILIEQIYRALTIIKGVPYHKS